MHNSFYKGVKWQQLRQSILRRDNYQCQYCKRYGKLIEASCIHHILPREDFPEYSYSRWNLISLCDRSHNEMHQRTEHNLTDKGIQLAIRTIRKNNINTEKIYKYLGL